MIRDFLLSKQGSAHLHALHAGDHLSGCLSVIGPAPAVHQKWIDTMADQPKPNFQHQTKEGGLSRSANCIPEKAKEDKLQNQYLDITAMIRSLQRTEGLSDCFRRGIADCDQLRCAWRQYCLEPADDLPSGNEI
jgi:hypothetical protein